MRQKPIVTHAWLVVVECIWVFVVELMVSVVTVEIDVHWVFSQLGTPDCSTVLKSELGLDQLNASTEELERVLKLPKGLPCIDIRTRLFSVPLILVPVTFLFLYEISKLAERFRANFIDFIIWRGEFIIRAHLLARKHFYSEWIEPLESHLLIWAEPRPNALTEPN